jgi:hypothetical protein
MEHHCMHRQLYHILLCCLRLLLHAQVGASPGEVMEVLQPALRSIP